MSVGSISFTYQLNPAPRNTLRSLDAATTGGTAASDIADQSVRHHGRRRHRDAYGLERADESPAYRFETIADATDPKRPIAAGSLLDLTA